MLHGDSFAFSALWSKHVHQRSNSAEMLAVECCWYGVYDQTILGCCQRASLPFGTIRAQNVQILSFFLTFLMIALIWNPTIIVTSKLFFQHSDYNLCHVPLVVLAVYSIGTPARRMARDHVFQESGQPGLQVKPSNIALAAESTQHPKVSYHCIFVVTPRLSTRLTVSFTSTCLDLCFHLRIMLNDLMKLHQNGLWESCNAIATKLLNQVHSKRKKDLFHNLLCINTHAELTTEKTCRPDTPVDHQSKQTLLLLHFLWLVG